MNSSNLIPKVEVQINENVLETVEGKSVSIFSPDPPTPEAVNLINTIGLEAYNAIMAIEHIKREAEMEGAQRPHVSFQVISCFLSVLITENPNHMHWDIVKAAMEKTDPSLITDTSLRDRTVRELINQVKKLKLKFSRPKRFNEIFEHDKQMCEAVKNGYEKDPIVEIYSCPSDFDSSVIDSEFEKNGFFIWDKAIIDLLSTIGKSGSEFAKEVRSSCQDLLISCKAGAADPLMFWFNLKDPSRPFHLSPFLTVLAQAILSNIFKEDAQTPKKTRNRKSQSYLQSSQLVEQKLKYTKPGKAAFVIKLNDETKRKIKDSNLVITINRFRK